MPAGTKNRKSRKGKKIFAIVDPSVGNYEKHPFFVKKANEAKAFLKEVGLPKKLAKTKKFLEVIDPKVGNYEKHPFFVKKANEARAILKVTGLPKKKLSRSK